MFDYSVENNPSDNFASNAKPTDTPGIVTHRFFAFILEEVIYGSIFVVLWDRTGLPYDFEKLKEFLNQLLPTVFENFRWDSIFTRSFVRGQLFDGILDFL